MATRRGGGERIVEVRSPDLAACMVAFADCDAVIGDLRSILRGWRIHEGCAPRSQAIVRLTHTRRGYLRVSAWNRKPSSCRKAFRDHGSDALFGVHYDLLRWYVESQRDRPCLHCAAVRFESGLVAFPNTTRAGKSTLTIQLALEGHQVFTDDWLPICQPGNFGLALGILPWLRLPAPVEVREAFRKFLVARRGPRNGRWTYVELQNEELAASGQTHPVRALVLLERVSRGPASLRPVASDRMLSELIRQNYARQVPSVQVFDSLHALAAGSECLSMRYASVRDAAKLLRREFGGAHAKQAH